MGTVRPNVSINDLFDATKYVLVAKMHFLEKRNCLTDGMLEAKCLESLNKEMGCVGWIRRPVSS